MASVQTPIIPIIGQLIADNPDTISLAQGVVYFDPPQQVLQHASDFGHKPTDHKYGPVQGNTQLLQLIEEKLWLENGIRGDLSKRIIITAGANMAFLNTLFAITDPGDEVILPTPYYFNQEMAIKMVNCDPVLIRTDDTFQIDPAEIQAAITNKTQAIVTISSNNPAGVVYSESVLRQINQICKEHNIYHICDEDYEYFTYDQIRHFSPASISEAQEHTISLYSLSKAYGFASWRIGYMLIPESLYMPVLKAQDTNLICASLIAQQAAVGALEAGVGYCRGKLSLIDKTRKLVENELATIKDFCTFPASKGAFYFLIKVKTSLDSMSFARRLIEEHKVAVLSGIAFGLTDGCYLRISYGALEPESAITGIRRFTEGLTKICHNNPY